MSWKYFSLVWTCLSFANYAVALYIIQRLVRTRREPRGTLAWILTLILLPFLGLLLYAFVGELSLERKIRYRRRRFQMIEPGLVKRTSKLSEAYNASTPENDVDPRQLSLMRLARKISGAVVTFGNDVVLYHDAEQAFLALSLAIESARKHVHLEYYIFADDETGRAVADLLVRKAAEGVEVRLLLDALGSWRLSRAFVKSLQDKGVKVAFFLPWGLAQRRLQFNFRNHRKLAIIDGTLAMTGSKNIADEYLGRKKKWGPWRDSYLRLKGPCVAQLQEIFVEDWHFASEEDISSDKYFPDPVIEGNQRVQIVPSGPDRRRDVLHQLFNIAAVDAQKNVCFITPYFVPDGRLLMVLTAAAYRGIRVQLLLPSRSDQWLTLWAGRSYYEELLEAGVEIYEYDKGMLHSKVAIVDSRWSMVGSANMDIRSFRLNFEMTTILYEGSLAEQLQLDFDQLITDSRRITPRDIAARTYGQSLAAGIARLAAPLL